MDLQIDDLNGFIQRLDSSFVFPLANTGWQRLT